MSAPLPRLCPEERRKMILEVAREVFLEAGYEASSMAMIAARLGGSKGTLYKYFPSKEDLFEAVMADHCVAQQERMSDIRAESDDIRGSLKRMGHIFLDIILSERNMGFYRMVVAEAPRSPEIGQMFFDSAVMGSTRRMTAFLARMAEIGALRIGDPQLAAQQFMGLCQARLHKARLMQAIAPPTEAEIDTEIDHAVDTFMAAFAVRPAAA